MAGLNKNKLPKHLQNVIDYNMKSNRGRLLLAELIGASYYRSVKGKIKRVKNKRMRHK